MRTLTWAGLAVLLLVLGVGDAAAQVPGPVRVKGELTAPAGIDRPVFVQVTFFVVGRDEYGFFQTPENVDKAYSYFDPAASRTLTFEVVLEPNREYEVQVDVLDDAGNPRIDGTYYFRGPAFAQQYGQETAILQGVTKNLRMSFGWEPRDPERANYVMVVPKGEGRYELIFYFNKPSGA